MTGQQQKLAMLTSKYNLFNAVTQPTREGNMLDLILSNDNLLISKISHMINQTISDHHILICELSIDMDSNESSDNTKFEYLTRIPDYDWKKATTEQLNQFTEDINQNDWNVLAEGLNNSDKLKLLYKLLEDNAEKNFKEKVTITKKKVISKDVRKAFLEN